MLSCFMIQVYTSHHTTGQNSETFLTYTGASICMQPEPLVTLAVEGASGVHTRVLTSSVMNETLINIYRGKIKSNKIK